MSVSFLRSIGSALCLLVVPAAASAATASLVADLNTTGPNELPLGVTSALLSLGDRVVFRAEEPSSGEELWVSDGTTLGTEILRDFCPGACSSSPKFIGRLRNTAIFFVGVNNELWSTDGTRHGTFRLKSGEFTNFPQPSCAPLPGLATPDYLYFAALAENTFDCDLWRTDGTAAGTLALHTGNFSISGLALAGGTVYFLTDHSDRGDGLWQSDGTPSGTRLVKQLTNASALTVVGTRLFFIADGIGAELWKSDGTSKGTRQVTEFAVSQPFLADLVALDGAVYFVVDDGAVGVDLWRSDGTSKGTVQVTDFDSIVPEGREFRPILTRLKGHLLFVAHQAGFGFYKLWISDGSPDTTRELTGCPGGCPEMGTATQLVILNDIALFSGRDPQNGARLWASDGTAAGTRLVRSHCSGPCEGQPERMVLIDGTVWFVAHNLDGVGVWRTDGTEKGTARIVQLQSSSSLSDYNAFFITEAAGKVLFAANALLGTQLWSSDGTPQGSSLVTRFDGSGPSAHPTRLTPFGDDVLFWTCDDTRLELWRSGASGTTSLLTRQEGCSSVPRPRAIAVAGGLAFFAVPFFEARLWRTDGTVPGTFPLSLAGVRWLLEPTPWRADRVAFLAANEGTGYALWESDGTTTGTRKLFELPPAQVPSDLQAVGSRLFFQASFEGIGGRQLWVSDGTEAGTRRLTSISFHCCAESLRLVEMDGTVFFVSDGGLELWRTDGTEVGTVPVLLPSSSRAGRLASDLVTLGGALYFTAVTGEDFRERGLWRSDGTAPGTFLVKLVVPESSSTPDPVLFTAVGANLYFVADDGDHGRELWRTDGTAAGTFMVRDILPGPGSSLPSSLAAAGGRLYFTATEGDNGLELWTSDGTAAGTHLVQDIAPEELSADPRELTVVGDQLFFSADDGLTGRELWVYPLDAPPGCVAGETVLCLGGGRFQVTAEWLDFAGHRGPGRAVLLTADTGTFWFFDPANVEVILKVLDGEGVNGHRWVFYGALSSVEYTLTVTDTTTGAARRYFNLLGRLSSVADTSAFGPDGAHAAGLSLGPQAVTGLSPFVHWTKVAAEPCAPSSNRVCLNGGRFAVEARWKDFAGNTGTAGAVPLAGGDTGYFWFFNPDNVEVVLKVLDGRPVNGKFWVFYGALSTVEYTLTVTDTETGQVRTFTNPAGRLASVAETQAF